MAFIEKILSANFVNLTGKKCDLGIDEAGRGPVLGPMVYGGLLCVCDKVDALKALGVDDSKALTEEKRDAIFAKLNDTTAEVHADLAYLLHVISPAYISSCMLARSKFSLNEVSHEAAIEIIQQCLSAGVLLNQVFIDTVGLPEAYQAKLEAKFPTLSITVSKKADSLFPVVSGASICAKVTRDAAVRAWKFIESNVMVPEKGYGSGYPGDPLTKEFLDQQCDTVFGYPSLVRFSWSTISTIMEKKSCVVRWDDDDLERTEFSTGGGENGSVVARKRKAPQSKMKDFFGANGAAPPFRRHQYFVDRRLKSVVDF